MRSKSSSSGDLGTRVVPTSASTARSRARAAPDWPTVVQEQPRSTLVQPPHPHAKPSVTPRADDRFAVSARIRVRRSFRCPAAGGGQRKKQEGAGRSTSPKETNRLLATELAKFSPFTSTPPLTGLLIEGHRGPQRTQRPSDAHSEHGSRSQRRAEEKQAEDRAPSIFLLSQTSRLLCAAVNADCLGGPFVPSLLRKLAPAASIATHQPPRPGSSSPCGTPSSSSSPSPSA